MEKRALIFDFDLTLADASPGIFKCANYALDSMGYEIKDFESVKRTIGLSLPETFKSLSGSANIEEIKEFVRLFVEKADVIMNDNTVVFPESLKIIPELSKLGYKLAIVSTKYRYRIDGILKREKIASCFDLVVGGEDVKKHKPNAEGLLLAANKLNVSIDKVLYIGDSLIDAETAKNAKVDFVGVLTGTNSVNDFENSNCKYVIKNLAELQRVI